IWSCRVCRAAIERRSARAFGRWSGIVRRYGSVRAREGAVFHHLLHASLALFEQALELFSLRGHEFGADLLPDLAEFDAGNPPGSFPARAQNGPDPLVLFGR